MTKKQSTQELKNNSVLSILIIICGMITACLGIAALVGWLAGLPMLTTFWPGMIPMAPSTALLFLLYGTGVILFARRPLTAAYRIALLIGVVGALAGGFFFAISLMGTHSTIEHLGIDISGMVNGVPVGHMSPLTAFCFILSGLAFLSFLLFSGRPYYSSMTFGLAFLTVLMSCSLLLAYLLGEPFLYGGGFIPPALPTSLAFFSLGTGLLLSSWQRTFSGGETPDASGMRASYVLVLIFLFLAVGILTAGYLYFRSHEKHYLDKVDQELSTIKELKVSQIVTWREERIRDVIIISDSEAIIKNISRFMENEKDLKLRSETLKLMSDLVKYYSYERAMLFNTAGRLMLWSGAIPEDAEGHAKAYIADAMRNEKVDFIDLHKGETAADIHFGLSVPLFLEADKERHLIGVLILHIDPFKFLYPLIQSWPTPSSSGETLLVRREGDEVLFINELRHRRDTAFSLRFPLTKKELPAAMAVSGITGIIEGIDYRGMPVIASIGAIPGSPWFIVSKMDKNEIYAPMRESLWTVVTLISLMILGSSLGIGLIWRQQRILHYRRLLDTEMQFNEERKHKEQLLLESKARLERSQEIAHLGSWELDIVNNTLTWSDEVYRIFGLQPQEFRATYEAFLEAVHPDDRKAVNEAYSNSLSEGRDTYEIEHRVVRKTTGEIRYVYEKCEHIRDASGKIIHSAGMVHDITERKKAEDELQRHVEELKRSNEELKQFAYIASHDLQEPLRMIASYMQLIERRYKGKLDKDADEFIAFAVEGATRLQEMITGLLHYSRLETRGKPLLEVNSSEILGTAVSNLKVLIEESGALVTSDRLPVIKADAVQFVQVFQNLIANAIKFKGEASPHIHVSAEQKGSEWVYSVRDNGIGISAEYNDRIFKIFQRLHGREYPGVGIGLSLCRRIVERHGGRIWFESEVGKGTTFYFTIPTKEEKKNE
ncbi:MAG: ATP-binding protein [Thermodesulfovibrionia bacterium]|nr:ATP-binding protein [Thermodesulfovibrionia bacterium]